MTQTIKAIGGFAIALSVVWWISILADLALRDPRFFDGWILVLGICGQLLFHARHRAQKFIAATEQSWRQLHIIMGYAVVAAFAAHTSFSLPDTLFEWIIWLVFVTVIITGIAGAYIIRAVPDRLEHCANTYTYPELAGHRQRIAREAARLFTEPVATPVPNALQTLYVARLRSYFAQPRHFAQHVHGSKRPIKSVLHQIEACDDGHVPQISQLIDSMKTLAHQKNDVDFAHAQFLLLRAWTFIHVPATYALVVLSLAHVAVMYAFSSGAP